VLFHAAWDTLRELLGDAKYLGATPGIIAALHTWGQTLMLHPHLHCLVTGGGWDGETWRAVRHGSLLPARVVMAVFRGKLLVALDTGQLRLPAGAVAARGLPGGWAAAAPPGYATTGPQRPPFRLVAPAGGTARSAARVSRGSLKPRDRASQRLMVRSSGESVACERPPKGLAFPSVPLVVSPALRRRCEPPVTLAELLKGLPLGQELPFKSP
jgi:hypothetical protein